MKLAVSSAEANHARRHTSHNGTPFWHTTFIGNNVIRQQIVQGNSPEDHAGLYPMAFMVEQDPGSVTQAHFHQADQFQVVILGNGKIGTQPVSAVSVQFTNAYTPYGPIQAGPDGLGYFTLRRHWDPGARFMPQSRTELRGRNSAFRQVVTEAEPALADEALSALPRVEIADVLRPESSGLAAWRYRLPPGIAVRGPDPADGGGQYWLVLGGEIGEPDGNCLPRNSCAFLSPEEPALHPVAGRGGAELLVLQFPR